MSDSLRRVRGGRATARVIASSIVSACCLFAPGAALAQGVKLNGPLPSGGDVGIGGVVRPFTQVWHDGTHVVWVADELTNGVLELFQAPVDGSAPPIRLNQPLVVGGNVGRNWTGNYPFRYFEVTPDDRYVVYTADAETNETQELYSVTTDGLQSPVKLSGSLVPGGAVFGFTDAPFLVTPDSGQVVFRGDKDVDTVYELYVAPVDGSAPPVKLNTPLAAGAVLEFFLTPDGSRVVYDAIEAAGAVVRLYSAPLAGGGAALLSGPLGLTQSTVYTDLFTITPAGTRVVFLDDGPSWELYSVPIDGSAAPILLHPAPSAGRNVALAPGGLGFWSPHATSPDGTRVLYSADHDTDDVFELYSAPIDGSTLPTKLSPPIFAVGEGIAETPVFSPDGARAVFLAVTDRSQPIWVYELFSVPLDGGEPAVRLNGALVADGYVADFLITPDSARAVYRARERDLVDSLYVVPIAGGASLRLTPSSLHTQNSAFLRSTRMGPNGRDAYFLGGAAPKLYSVDVRGGARPVWRAGSGVESDWTFAAGGRRVVYRSDEDTSGVFEIFSRRVTTGIAHLP